MLQRFWSLFGWRRCWQKRMECFITRVEGRYDFCCEWLPKNLPPLWWLEDKDWDRLKRATIFPFFLDVRQAKFKADQRRQRRKEAGKVKHFGFANLIEFVLADRGHYEVASIKEQDLPPLKYRSSNGFYCKVVQHWFGPNSFCEPKGWVSLHSPTLPGTFRYIPRGLEGPRCHKWIMQDVPTMWSRNPSQAS